MLFFPTDSYRSRDEVQSVRKTRDPILGLREKLLDSGLADTEDIKVLQCVYWADWVGELFNHVGKGEDQFITRKTWDCFTSFEGTNNWVRRVLNFRKTLFKSEFRFLTIRVWFCHGNLIRKKGRESEFLKLVWLPKLTFIIITLISYFSGLYGSWKTWKFTELYNFIFQTWKVMKVWVMEVMEKQYTFRE